MHCIKLPFLALWAHLSNRTSGSSDKGASVCVELTM